MNEVTIIPQSQPMDVQEILKEPDITPEEAEKAAEVAGLSVIRIKRLKASSIVGKFLEQIGATRVGRTVVITAQERIEDALNQCDQLLDKADPEAVGLELLVEIMKIKQAYTEQLIKSGLAQMKDEEKAHAVAAHPQPLRIPFPPGSELAIRTGGE